MNLSSICGKKSEEGSNIGGIGSWLNTEDPLRYESAAISLSFPVTKRTCRNNPFGISETEIMDICLYVGCCDSVRPGRFYQTKNAYQSFNLLMMDGLDGENARIGVEKQKPSGLYIRDWKRTLDVFKSVFSAMCKYYKKSDLYKGLLFRADRLVNTIMIRKHKRTIAFTSTSKAGILECFSKEKKDATILSCKLDRKVPLADLEEILKKDYVFSEEAEVLLPPYLGIVEFSDKSSSYEVKFGSMTFDEACDTKEIFSLLESTAEEAAEVLDKFVEDPDLAKDAMPDDYRVYVNWKAAFQKLVGQEMRSIWIAQKMK